MKKETDDEETKLLKTIAEDTAMVKRARDVGKDVLMASLDKKVNLSFNFSIGNSHGFRTIRVPRELAGDILKFIEYWGLNERTIAEAKFDRL